MTGVRQARALALAAVVALAAHLALPPAAFLPAILGLILLFGMPHGALDLILARQSWPLSGAIRHAGFLLGYLGIAAAVVLLWYLAPGVALLAFLAYSAFHFADDWPMPRVGAIAAGAAVLAFPALLHPDRVDVLFAWLGAEGGGARRALAAAGVAGLAIAGWCFRRRPGALGLLAGLGLLAAVLPPLGYFFVYFCGLHAPGHVRRVSRRLGLNPAVLRREMVVPTVVSLLGVAVAGAALVASGVEPGAAGLRATFIAFAALTVPHMVLVDLFSRGAGPVEGPPSGRTPPAPLDG